MVGYAKIRDKEKLHNFIEANLPLMTVIRESIVAVGIGVIIKRLIRILRSKTIRPIFLTQSGHPQE